MNPLVTDRGQVTILARLAGLIYQSITDMNIISIVYHNQHSILDIVFR